MLRQARLGVRVLQITDLFIKHGLGSVLDLVGVSPRLFRRTPTEAPGAASLPIAHRVRLLLQDLGPTFVKLGQIASTRSDILSEEFVRELQKLQDQVEPLPFSEIAAVVESELARPLDQLFQYFSTEPLASASIGQVHRAVTLDGRAVVVKVQRPGVEEIIRNDMAILGWAARRIERRIDLARRANVTALLEEFEDLLLDELLYNIEGRNADRIRQNMSSNQRIRVPEVYWDLSTRRVLTLQDVSGIKLSNRPALIEAALDLPAMSVALSQAYMKQILVDGFFHGDPHQGNFFVDPDGCIAIIDFGIMGRLDEKFRDSLVEMFLAVFRQDSEEAVQQLVSLGAVAPDTDMAALVRDVDRLLQKYYFLPRQEIRIGEIMSKVLEVVHRHDVQMPTDMALLAKVLLTIEGICLSLDPNFDFNTAVRPFATELMERNFSPMRLAGEVARSARELQRLARVAPTQVMDILSKADRGRLRLIVQYDQSDRSLDHLYEIGNRLAMTLGLSSTFLGSVALLHIHGAPFLFGLGYAGCILSFVGIVRLFMVMIGSPAPHRQGKPKSPR